MLKEIRQGYKKTHWIWFIFPQIKGLGRSDTAIYYALDSKAEAASYLKHKLLSKRLIEISNALLKHSDVPIQEILGEIDALKLQSSMTLFANLHNTNPVFEKVLDTFFDGEQDQVTIQLLHKE